VLENLFVCPRQLMPLIFTREHANSKRCGRCLKIKIYWEGLENDFDAPGTIGAKNLVINQKNACAQNVIYLFTLKMQFHVIKQFVPIVEFHWPDVSLRRKVTGYPI